MPKVPKEVSFKSHSIENKGVSYSRVGILIEGTRECLALSEWEDGFVLYHVHSGLCIGSNLNNVFPTFEEGEEFAQKFWEGIKSSKVATRTYLSSSERRTLRVVVPPSIAAMAKNRTNRAKNRLRVKKTKKRKSK